MTSSSVSTSDGLSQFISCTMRDPSELLSVTFYKGRPKNLLSGALRAAGNLVMGTGIAVGASCMVATRNYRQHSFLSAILYSLLTFSSSCFLGGVMATQQLARGVLGSLESMRHSLVGNALWDETRGLWYKVHLQAEWDRLPQTNEDLDQIAREAFTHSEQSEESEEGRHSLRERHAEMAPAVEEPDDSYYKLLGVERTATAPEISKAYRIKALTQHPDKCGDTAASRLNFQRLSEAYNVLSNPVSREAYDHKSSTVLGESSDVATTNVSLVDLLVFPFTEPLVGPLAITWLLTPFHFYSFDLRVELQHRRELRVAQQLCSFLDSSNGLENARTVVQDAIASPCGTSVVSWVLQEYIAVSRQFFLRSIAKELDELRTSSARAAHLWKGYWTLYKKLRWNNVREDQDNIVAVIIALSESNIRQTVRQAGRMVLYDESVPLEQRKKRANKLKELVTIIQTQMNAQV